MKIYYSKKINIICAILSLIFLRLSYWQYNRHQEKKAYIEKLETRLSKPAIELNSAIEDINKAPSTFIHRKLKISGEYDFEHEVILRNRSWENFKGVHVISPLKINKNQAILVDRGFIPLNKSLPEQRKIFQKNSKASFIGLGKESKSKTFFLAPSDPETNSSHRVDAFLRIDIPKIQKQIPYKLLPVYVEIMNTENSNKVTEQIVKSSSGKSELLFLPSRANKIKVEPDLDISQYPIATFDTVIPPGRHFGYIFEWAIMAIMTLLIGFVLQLRPRYQNKKTISS